MRSAADEKQIGGGHYKTGGMEHWTFVSGFRIGYLEGCATKYLIRWRSKNGLEDLRKSEHFLEKLIEMVQSGAIQKNRAKIVSKILKQFYEDAKISYPENLAVDMIFKWSNVGHLVSALKIVRDLIDEVESGPTSAYVNQG